MSFLMAFATMEKHDLSAFYAEIVLSSVDIPEQDATYLTSDVPYFFFANDYIAPLSFALDENPETAHFKCKYTPVSKKTSYNLHIPGDGFPSQAGNSYPSLYSKPCKDYYVFTLRNIRI